MSCVFTLLWLWIIVFWILYNYYVFIMRSCVSCKKFLAPEHIDDHLSCRRCRSCSKSAPCQVCSGWDERRWQEFETHCKSVERKRLKKVRSSQGAPAPSVVVSGAGPGKTTLVSLGKQELGAPAGGSTNSSSCSPQADGEATSGAVSALREFVVSGFESFGSRLEKLTSMFEAFVSKPPASPVEASPSSTLPSSPPPAVSSVRGSSTDTLAIQDVPLPPPVSMVATATVAAPSVPGGSVALGVGHGKSGGVVYTSACTGPSTVTTNGHGMGASLHGELCAPLGSVMGPVASPVETPTTVEASDGVAGSTPGVMVPGFGWVPGHFPDYRESPEIAWTGQVRMASQVGGPGTAGSVGMPAPPPATGK